MLTLQGYVPLLGLPALMNGMLTSIMCGYRVWGSGLFYNVGPGMIRAGSQLLDFQGRGAVRLPTTFIPGALNSVDRRPY